MKVFIVLEHDYDGDYIRGVYSTEEAAQAHETHGGINYWVTDEDVQGGFIAPASAEPEAPRQCDAVSIYTVFGVASTETQNIPCRLMRGHDGPHECFVPSTERTP